MANKHKTEAIRKLIHSNQGVVEDVAKKGIFDVTAYPKKGGIAAKSGSNAATKRMMNVRERLRQKLIESKV